MTETQKKQLTSEQEQAIALRAYQKWVAGGRKHGLSQQDWFEAEKELEEEAKQRAQTKQQTPSEMIGAMIK